MNADELYKECQNTLEYLHSLGPNKFHIHTTMKKNYIKPTMRAHKVEPIVMTPSSGHHDNGKHNGWNNPNNPHYPYNPDED